MSILIKGMNMPKDIAPNVHQKITLIISGDGTICDVDRNQLPYEAVEIKEPHGRLIDAEALSSQFHKDTGRLHLITTHGFVSECIEDAPTVVEAEGDEHE